MPGMASTHRMAFLVIMGRICLRYIFSRINGTQITRLGRTCERALSSRLGEGILPKTVMWVPVASGTSMSNAHP